MKTSIYDKTRPLISIHIPKCAGTSFSDVLKKWYGKKLLTHYHSEKWNKRPKKYRLKRGLFKNKLLSGICIHGHFNNARGNGVEDYYPEISQKITILRDPFDLHVSNFFYVKRQDVNNKKGATRGGKPHEIIANKWSLEDFLRNRNKSYLLDFFPKRLTLENYKEVLEEQYLYVGISEQLQKSVEILSEVLGFESQSVPVSNISKKDEEIPDGAREKFQEENHLEYAVYQYVCRNWGNQ